MHLLVPGTGSMRIVEEKQHLKYLEPEINLWKVLSIFTYVKLYVENSVLIEA